MNEIDRLIARSRKKGGFSKKGYFTLEAQKAKQKIGAYALPAVEYAILEFIQSATAVGATFIDVSVSGHPQTVSFVGGSYTQSELAHLFDHLLIDGENSRSRAMRRLAVGVVAVLRQASSSVVVESGDGTVAGSCRLEIENPESPFEVGRPVEPIDGTFVRFDIEQTTSWREKLETIFGHSLLGVSRGADGAGSDDDDKSDMTSLVYERCLYSFVPLQLNGELLTGYTAAKAIQLRHLKHAVEIDEGDLYGGIGLSRDAKRPAELKVLANGIWVGTLWPKLPKGITGVVGYERLHRTASQYGIVMDDRVLELTMRLKKYVEMVLVTSGVTSKARLDAFFEVMGLDVERGAETLKHQEAHFKKHNALCSRQHAREKKSATAKPSTIHHKLPVSENEPTVSENRLGVSENKPSVFENKPSKRRATLEKANSKLPHQEVPKGDWGNVLKPFGTGMIHSLPSKRELTAMMDAMPQNEFITAAIKDILHFVFSIEDTGGQMGRDFVVEMDHQISKAVRINATRIPKEKWRHPNRPDTLVSLNPAHETIALIVKDMRFNPLGIYQLVFVIMNEIQKNTNNQKNDTFEQCELSLYRPLLRCLQPDVWEHVRDDTEETTAFDDAADWSRI
ncbi:MAG: hypothetical protein JXR76_09975 [Deltaproteobacteria bacterium]|nr:hypothetical protein [Deltaproteobacteria bacterium]